MVNERLKRLSDGNVVDLNLQEAEQADTSARARRVIMVNSSGTVLKVSQIEEIRAGSDCNGIDGATGRVLTLQNTSTSGAPVSVFVDNQIIALSDMTIVHNSSSSTITFSINIYNSNTIRVFYYI